MNHTLKRLFQGAALMLGTVSFGASVASAQTLPRPTTRTETPILLVDDFTPVRTGTTQIELPWCIGKVFAILPGSSLFGAGTKLLRDPLIRLTSYDR